MRLVAPPIAVPGGERIKAELFHVEQVQRLLFEHHIDRHAFVIVIVIGGGAVLDAIGLVAATTHRGVRLIRVPTTVLAQDDPGVGVKNGVNLFGSKNFVGTFAPPFAVLNDLALLDALPPREKIAGMAEAVKVALIRDRDFFHWLERHADDLVLFERAAVGWMIRRWAELHMRQIAQGGDPFETGSARPLDFGHWAAHKLEMLTRHHLRHGEAVAIGIALDTRYSVLAGLLAEADAARACGLLEHLGFRLWHPALASRDLEGRHALLEGLREFQEHLGGELTITLLAGLGRGVEVHAVDEALILEAIAWLEARANAP
jgi:3-dehydroquinate synthase